MREGTSAEFAAIRAYPNISIRHMNTKRIQDVLLEYCGQMVGWMTRTYKGKRVVSESFEVDETFLQKATTC